MRMEKCDVPRKPIPPEDDKEDEVPSHRLPAEVIGVWERKRRILQSKKDAKAMWAPILEGYRAYSETLKYIHVIETLDR
jgi:hypothetical protein